MASVNETNFKRVETALNWMLLKKDKVASHKASESASELQSLLAAIIAGIQPQGNCRLVVESLAWFALDSLYESKSGHLPTVSLRFENLSTYLVFGRIYKCKNVLKDLTWGFAHHMARVMLTGNKIAEVDLVNTIEAYPSYTHRSHLAAQLPVISKLAGEGMMAALRQMSPNKELILVA